MIKQQNKFSFALTLLFGALELISILGAYLAHYFTKTRLGMLRHVVYLNGKWEESYPVYEIKFFSIFVLVLLLITAIIRFFRSKSSSLAEVVALIFALCISIWTIYFLAAYSTETNRAYYIVCICFMAASIFHHAFYNCFLSLRSKTRK